ncbi:hypothetical protein OHB19_41690 [Streptomyces sp. NBC_00893]|nr:group II intron maturase-specific domain-containing protein [Streptomyces sp. NBC_00893]MCX4851664.1 hypothetical protein [Streptomyces sp. NBC_00893]
MRYANDFVVLVHGTRSEAETLKAEIAELLASRLKMPLSDEKTHITHITRITHIDDRFVFLGFHIQRKPFGDGRRVVLTIPPKPTLASVMHRVKKLTGRSTRSLSLEEVLRSVNPVLRGWTALFPLRRIEENILLPWLVCVVETDPLDSLQAPHLTWKQLRSRYYGADRITEGGIVLYNQAKMRVQRYTFRRTSINVLIHGSEPEPVLVLAHLLCSMTLRGLYSSAERPPCCKRGMMRSCGFSLY